MLTIAGLAAVIRDWAKEELHASEHEQRFGLLVYTLDHMLEAEHDRLVEAVRKQEVVAVGVQDAADRAAEALERAPGRWHAGHLTALAEANQQAYMLERVLDELVEAKRELEAFVAATSVL